MRVMISCGEPSGDLYAGALTRELLRLDPSALITGFGSQRLRSAGATLVDDFQGLSVTGLLEVARVLPRTYAIYRRLLAHAATTRPDVFVAVDFPEPRAPSPEPRAPSPDTARSHGVTQRRVRSSGTSTLACQLDLPDARISRS